MKKKFLIITAMMVGCLFNNDVFCSAAVDPSKVPTSLAVSAGQRDIDVSRVPTSLASSIRKRNIDADGVPTSLAKTVEKPVVSSDTEIASVQLAVDENIVLKSTMKRIHLTAEKNNSVEAVINDLKKKAVARVINDLRKPQAEYSSDFQDVIDNFNEYIIAVHVVDRDKLFVKIDVRSAALKEIIDSKFVRNNKKIPVASDSVVEGSALHLNGDNVNPQLTNNGEPAIGDNRNTVTLGPVPDEVYQPQPNEMREAPRGNNAGDQGERRHMWAQNA